MQLAFDGLREAYAARSAALPVNRGKARRLDCLVINYIAENIKKTGTVLRGAFSRMLETPFNENLLLSSVTGVGGLEQNVFGANPAPIKPGLRNQFNTGLQQAIGRHSLLDADYYWKYTDSAYDYSVLLNTTIVFPIARHKSKLDGITGRVSTTNLKGFPGLLDIRPQSCPIFSTRNRRADPSGRTAGRRLSDRP